MNGRAVGAGRASGRAPMDALDPRALRRLGVRVIPLGGRAVGPPGTWEDWLGTKGHYGPSDDAAFRIDFADWLAGLPTTKRRIAELLAEGHRGGRRGSDARPVAGSHHPGPIRSGVRMGGVPGAGRRGAEAGRPGERRGEESGAAGPGAPIATPSTSRPRRPLEAGGWPGGTRHRPGRRPPLRPRPRPPPGAEAAGHDRARHSSAPRRGLAEAGRGAQAVPWPGRHRAGRRPGHRRHRARSRPGRGRRCRLGLGVGATAAGRFVEGRGFCRR